MTIKYDDVVTLHYTVSTTDGAELDSSKRGEPLCVLLGSSFLIEGLEEALVGKQAGDEFDVTVPPHKAYGERFDNLVQSVDKSMFDDIEVEPGMSFRATTDEGEQSVIVVDVDDDQVTVDGNHPLAGVTLSFQVEVIDSRDATPSELAENRVDCSRDDCCQSS